MCVRQMVEVDASATAYLSAPTLLSVDDGLSIIAYTPNVPTPSNSPNVTPLWQLTDHPLLLGEG